MDTLLEAIFEGIGALVEFTLDGLINLLTKARKAFRRHEKLKSYKHKP